MVRNNLTVVIEEALNKAFLCSTFMLSFNWSNQNLICAEFSLFQLINGFILAGLMINADMLLASSRRLFFGGPVIARGLIGKSLFTIK